eukprot:TRINITY_DN111257_c0_g1_i1.p1 TRINITY_DN111257_c0_g1~~TRINITY_DN111257_c0_g1_i1.p1  ORF type:complete len:602 (+),score=113.40 TRINITY_DN111257_c0_g1_i1:103-1908(+)
MHLLVGKLLLWTCVPLALAERSVLRKKHGSAGARSIDVANVVDGPRTASEFLESSSAGARDGAGATQSTVLQTKAHRQGGRKTLIGKSSLIDDGATARHGEQRMHAKEVVGLDLHKDAKSVPSNLLQANSSSEQSPGGGKTTTTSKNWFQRMGEAFGSVVMGIVLIIFSIPVLWVGEKRSAQMESVISLAESEHKVIGSESADPDNRGELVHLSGDDARGVAPVSDERFKQVQAQSGVIAIRSDVEVYQWVEEKEEREEKNSLGGGTTTTTTYSYRTEWRSSRIASSGFNESNGHENFFPVAGLELGSDDATCNRVEYGGGFLLPQGLVCQLTEYRYAGHSGNPFGLGDCLAFETTTFTKKGEHYYHEQHEGQTTVGDTRVSIEYVADGPATIMAVQAQGTEEGRDSFLPYRLISRGWCGISDDERKRRLIEQGERSNDDVAKDEECSLGPLNLLFCCCLCACNLVNRCIMGIALPEVYHVWDGQKSVRECIDYITGMNNCLNLTLRIVGWLMMAIGLHSIFKPVFVLIDIIPFFGPWLSDNIEVIVGFCCAVVTLVVSSIIVGLAYLVYHPKKALLYLILPMVAIAGVAYLCMNGKLKTQ